MHGAGVSRVSVAALNERRPLDAGEASDGRVDANPVGDGLGRGRPEARRSFVRRPVETGRTSLSAPSREKSLRGLVDRQFATGTRSRTAARRSSAATAGRSTPSMATPAGQSTPASPLPTGTAAVTRGKRAAGSRGSPGAFRCVSAAVLCPRIHPAGYQAKDEARQHRHSHWSRHLHSSNEHRSGHPIAPCPAEAPIATGASAGAPSLRLSPPPPPPPRKTPAPPAASPPPAPRPAPTSPSPTTPPPRHTDPTPPAHRAPHPSARHTAR